VNQQRKGFINRFSIGVGQGLRTGPNNPVELTAYSALSFVAPASGSNSPGALGNLGIEGILNGGIAF